MAEQREVPPIELSAKYMAWNVKQIDEHLKKISVSIDELVQIMKQRRNQDVGIQPDTPF